MLITKIVRSRKERKSYAIYVDDVLAFHLSEEAIVRHGLRRGMQIDQQTTAKLKSAAALDRARTIAINLISYRHRSAKEIISALTRRGFSTDIAHDVVHHLHDINLLNDLEFARMFVRDKMRGKPMGKAMMRRKLLDKGISFQVVERALKEHVTEKDEREAAARLATKKLKVSRSRFAGLSSVKRQKRLLDYLLSRGFSTEVAMETVRNTFSKS